MGFGLSDRAYLVVDSWLPFMAFQASIESTYHSLEDLTCASQHEAYCGSCPSGSAEAPSAVFTLALLLIPITVVMHLNGTRLEVNRSVFT